MANVDTDQKTNLLQIMTDLEHTKGSGVILVTRGTLMRTLEFRDGFLVAITSDLPKDDVLRILLRMPTARDKIKAIQASAKTKGESALHKIVAAKIVPPEELKKAEYKRCQEILDSILNNPDDKIELLSDHKLDEPPIQIKLQVSELLGKLKARESTWQTIKAALPNVSDLVQLTPAASTPELSAGLKPAERLIFQTIDGKKTVQEIRDKSPVYDFETLQILVNFKTKGYINLRSEQESKAAPVEQVDKSKLELMEQMRAAENLYRSGSILEAVETLEALAKKFSDNTRIITVKDRWLKDLNDQINSVLIHDSVIPKVIRQQPGAKPSPINSQEGFLLSRIDGQTRLKYLQNMCGIPDVRFKRAIFRLYKLGLIDLQAQGTRQISFSRGSGDDYEPGIRGKKFELSYDELKATYDRFISTNYYDVLGVPRDAPVEVIREKFAKLSKTFHPDMYQDKDSFDSKTQELLELLFQIVHTAFRKLANPDQRKEYDLTLQHTNRMLMDDVFTVSPQRSAASSDKPIITPPVEREKPPIVESYKKTVETQPKTTPPKKPGFSVERITDKVDTPKSSDSTQTASGTSSAVSSGKTGSGDRKELAQKTFAEGMEAYHKKKYKDAQDRMITALKMDSRNIDYYHQLSIVQLEWGVNLNEAELNVKRAITLDRENPIYYLTLARIYRQKEDFVMAERYYKTALAWGVPDADAEKELKEMRKQMDSTFFSKIMGRMKKK